MKFELRTNPFWNLENPLHWMIALACLGLWGCSSEFQSMEDSLALSSQNQLLSGSIQMCRGPTKLQANRPKRVSRFFYINSLQDLLGKATVDRFETALDLLPSNTQEGISFSTGSSVPSDGAVNAYFEIAEQISSYIVESEARISPLSSCVVSAPATQLNTCLGTFLDKFATPLFRSPLKATERSVFYKLFDDAQKLGDRKTAFALLLQALLTDPRFLYSMEKGQEVLPSGNKKLDSFEVAARLALVMWQSVPDAELIDLAQKNLLSSAAEVKAQAKKMLNHVKARRMFRQFIAEWVGLPSMPEFNYSPLYLNGQTLTGLREAMQEELLSFAEHVVFDLNGTFSDLLTSNSTRVTDKNLANLYQMPLSSEWQNFPQDQRAGLFTRAAFLASGTNASSPIRRGVFTIRNILCDQLPLPPPDTVLMRPTGVDPTLSIRQQTDVITQSSNCMTCHSRINPLGHSLGHYDGLGRYQTVEMLFNSQGAKVAEKVVDSKTEVNPDLGLTAARPVAVNDAVEFSRVLADSNKTHQCFALQMGRYFQGREVELASDGCNLQKVFELSKFQSKSVKDLLLQMISDPLFLELGN